MINQQTNSMDIFSLLVSKSNHQNCITGQMALESPQQGSSKEQRIYIYQHRIRKCLKENSYLFMCSSHIIPDKNMQIE